MSWPLVPLRRIGQVVNGGTPSAIESHWDGDIPWATPVDLGKVNGGTLVTTDRSITLSGLDGGSGSVGPGSILVSTRAPVGYVALVNRTTAFNQGCRGVEIRSAFEPRFLLYALMAANREMDRRANGTTFKELSGAGLKETLVANPPRPIQEAIADYLDRETARIDDLIAEQEALVRLLTRRRASTITEAMGSCAGSPLMALRRVLIEVRQGWSPNCESMSADGREEWGVLKIGCAKNGEFRPEENKRLPAEELVRPQFAVRARDVVMSRANTQDLVGSAAVVPSGYPRLLLSDLLYSLVPSPAIDPEFLVLQLEALRTSGALASSAKGSSASMQKLSQRDIRELPVRVPDQVDQKDLTLRVARDLSAIHKLVSETQSLIALLKERRAALITAAVTGELDVTGP